MADMTHKTFSLAKNNTIYLAVNQEKIEDASDVDIIDMVGFGMDTIEFRSLPAEGDSSALNPSLGQSIQRKYVDDNFLDSDNNANDFEIQNCPSPKSFSSIDCLIPTTTTTTTTTAPSSPTISYITEFSWHPFEKDSSKIVVDFRIDSYPFIPAANYAAMAFYLHSDEDDPSVNFGIPIDYLGDKYNWELHSDTPGLLLTYPNYVSGTPKVGSIIFTTDGNIAASSAAPRKYSYRIDKLPSDNHFIIDVTGATQGQGLNFTPDQYVTIGYYGYASGPSSYLKLIAYDPTKFYFDASNYYHQPTNVLNFEAKCDNDLCNNLIFSWTPASDEDQKDILKYDIHYVFAESNDNLNNNELTRRSWEWYSSYNVLGEPIFNAQENKLHLQV
ncbi:MAG: hypothetical protein Q7J06_10595, partial [Bacteroidales bacterium]|nr:hypothetical protein [Bacteroidales bacterium]